MPVVKPLQEEGPWSGIPPGMTITHTLEPVRRSDIQALIDEAMAEVRHCRVSL